MLLTYNRIRPQKFRFRSGSSFAPHFCAPTGVSGFPLKWRMRSLIPDPHMRTLHPSAISPYKHPYYTVFKAPIIGGLKTGCVMGDIKIPLSSYDPKLGPAVRSSCVTAHAAPGLFRYRPK